MPRFKAQCKCRRQVQVWLARKRADRRSCICSASNCTCTCRLHFRRGQWPLWLWPPAALSPYFPNVRLNDLNNLCVTNDKALIVNVFSAQGFSVHEKSGLNSER